MDLVARVAPGSSNQIVFVVLMWAGIATVSTYLVQSPLVRWETVLGTVAVMAWSVWAIQYRLEQYRQEQYRRNQ